MNLLTDSWLPVRSHNGLARVSPSTLEGVQEIASGRTDFDATLLEFLIGLKLTEDLDPKAFDHTAFMQEPALLSDATAKTLPIESLLIESPSDSARRDNADFFVKRGRHSKLCVCCSMSALYTLQSWAPAGGCGHYTGLRGGGPYTCFAEGKDLEETVSLNALLADNWMTSNVEDGVLQWTTRPGKVFADSVSPLACFWAAPRRIAIEWSGIDLCDLCAERRLCASTFKTRPRGHQYSGPWRHPMAAYRMNKGNNISIKPTYGGLMPHDWIPIVFGGPKRLPAHSIARLVAEGFSGPLRAVGFHVEPGKAKVIDLHSDVCPLDFVGIDSEWALKIHESIRLLLPSFRGSVAAKLNLSTTNPTVVASGFRLSTDLTTPIQEALENQDPESWLKSMASVVREHTGGSLKVLHSSKMKKALGL